MLCGDEVSFPTLFSLNPALCPRYPALHSALLTVRSVECHGKSVTLEQFSSSSAALGQEPRVVGDPGLTVVPLLAVRYCSCPSMPPGPTRSLMLHAPYTCLRWVVSAPLSHSKVSECTTYARDTYAPILFLSAASKTLQHCIERALYCVRYNSVPSAKHRNALLDVHYSPGGALRSCRKWTPASRRSHRGPPFKAKKANENLYIAPDSSNHIALSLKRTPTDFNAHRPRRYSYTGTASVSSSDPNCRKTRVKHSHARTRQSPPSHPPYRSTCRTWR